MPARAPAPLYSRLDVSSQERSGVLEERQRYVARGVSTPALTVSRASGALVWDVGRAASTSTSPAASAA